MPKGTNKAHKTPDTVGGRLREARKAARLSLSQAAGFLKISKAAVGAWEVDRNQPVYHHLQLAAELYKTTAQWLLDGKGPMPQPGEDDPQVELQKTLRALEAAGYEPTEITPAPGGRYNVKFKRRGAPG